MNMDSYAWLGSLRRVLWLPLLVMPLLLLAACDEAETQPEPAAPAATLYKGVAQGLTSEGFPFLGAADAPVTLTDHSDFL